MTTLLITHPVCIEHDTGSGHPERPDRLRAVLEALADAEFASLTRLDAPLASTEQIERVHDGGHVKQVLAAIPGQGLKSLDADTIISPRSGEAALRAAGALCAAVDTVMAGAAGNAFCAVRPPGHHAEPSRTMGFCLFNNVAIGALHACAEHGLERVAVVDFDVHHGNGTQAAFEDDPQLFLASTHQWPLYPGTGAADERGVAGNIVNVPLAPLSGSQEFRKAIVDIVLPALASFSPEFILVSAGFDGHINDPLAQMCLTEADYGWVTGKLADFAATHCAGRLVSTLEGGYDLAALKASTIAHVRALMAAGES